MSSSFKPVEESGQGHSQSASHLGDISKTQIAFATLDRAHECSVNAAFVGEPLLRVAALGSKLPYSLPQGF